MQSDILALAKAIEYVDWVEDSPEVVTGLPQTLQNIMADRGSLTTILKGLANNTFQVKVIAERLDTPFTSELTKLDLPKASKAVVREVELQIHGESVVYARSIIPHELTVRSETGLASLGSKPLGHLLFKDGKMRKSRREFAQVEGVFGRRTPYDYEGGTILVNEFFLESINKYL